MSLPSGTRLGPYEVVRLLGAGGMGEVYRARDTRLTRDVALKVLTAELAASPDRLARFEREARAASALSHPAIVSVYDIGQADGHWFIAMELVEGGPLRGLLTERPVPTRRLLDIAVPIAQGLARAHRSGIVHRDLKPENVMVGPDGVVKIVDFGIAKLMPATENADDMTVTVQHKTAPGAVLGTVSYMSPEQTAGRTVDARSDQFSFGTMLVEMATGKHPFLRQTTPQTQSAIIEHNPASVRSTNPELPLPLAWIIERCLAKDPAERYGSTDDLARDLARVRDHLSDPGLTPAPLVSGGRRSFMWPAVAIAVAIISALGAVAVWLLRPQAGTATPPSHLALLLGGDLQYSSSFTFDAAISPDGSTLAFEAPTGAATVQSNVSKTSIYLRPLDRPEAQLLVPGTGPLWSPDGQWIAFYQGRTLKKVRATGGPVVDVAPNAGNDADWSADDVIVFGDSSDSPVQGIRRTSASGGVAQVVSTLDRSLGHTHHLSPQVLPGGLVLYTIRSDGPKYQVAVQSLDGGTPRILAENSAFGRYIGDGMLLLQRGSTLLVASVDSEFHTLGPIVPVAENVLDWPFSANWAYSNGTLIYRPTEIGGRALVWVSPDGRPEPTGAPIIGYANPRLSPSGTKIAAHVGNGAATDVSVFDTASMRLQPVTTDHQSRTPIWSVDGSHLLVHRRASVPDIYKWRVDGSGAAEQVTRVGNAAGAAFLSKDGSLVYHQVDPATNYGLWVLPANSASPRPLLETRELEAGARLHPSERWFAFAAKRSGLDEVWVASWPVASSNVRVSGDGSREPTWARDGKTLFYRLGTKMFAVSFQEGNPPVLGRARELFDAPYFMAGGPGNTQYDVAPDGRFLMMKVQENPRPYVVVLQGWREKLLETIGGGRQ